MASPFSGKAGRNAAMWTAGYLEQLKPEIRDALMSGKEEALGYLLGPGGATEAIKGGYGGALDELKKAYEGGFGAYREAAGAFAPAEAEAMKGYGMLSNALGLGGAAGTTAAQEAFQAGPGYQWNVSQAQKQADRRAAQMGLLTSGNAQAATTELAHNLANQEYGNWIKNLQPYQSAAGTLATNRAQVLANLGNLYGQEGSAIAGLGGNEASALANIYGTAANTATGASQNWANVLGGIGGQIANVGMQGMQAGQQAAQNRMGALMGGLQLGGQALGGIMGLGTGGGATVGGNFLSGLFGKS